MTVMVKITYMNIFFCSADFEEYFTTEVVGSTVTIRLVKPLTLDILDSYSVLSLVLEAQVEGAINGHTIISITLPDHGTFKDYN